MDCPLATDHPEARTSTIMILHTIFHTRLGLELGPGAPSSLQFGSMEQTSEHPRSQQTFIIGCLPKTRRDRKSSDLDSEVAPNTERVAKS